MHRLQKVKFTLGHQGDGYQEVDESGRLVALYDSDGEQLARLADSDRYPHTAWEFVSDLGEFCDSDQFWSLVTPSSVEH